MDKIEFPITQDNFPKAWIWMEEKRIQAIQRKYARKISGAVADLAFFLMMCVVAFGVFRQLNNPGFQTFLSNFPVLPGLWDWLKGQGDRLGLSFWALLGALLGASYVLAYALAAATAWIVRLCCNPPARSIPEEDSGECARQLRNNAKRLENACKKKYRAGKTVYNILFLMICGAVVTAYIIKVAVEDNMASSMDLLELMGGPALFPAILGCWLGYALVDLPLIQLLRTVYILKIPEDLVAQTESYFLERNPDHKEKLREEDRILAEAERIKARRRKEQEEILAELH